MHCLLDLLTRRQTVLDALKVIHKYKLENERMMLCVPTAAPRKQMVPLVASCGAFSYLYALLSSPFLKTANALAPKHTKAMMLQ